MHANRSAFRGLLLAGLFLASGPVAGQDAKSAKDLKTIRPTVAEITKGVPEVIKQWRETFGV